MDPKEALRQLLIGIAEGDREATENHAYALAGWLEKGGFMPTQVDLIEILPEVLVKATDRFLKIRVAVAKAED